MGNWKLLLLFTTSTAVSGIDLSDATVLKHARDLLQSALGENPKKEDSYLPKNIPLFNSNDTLAPLRSSNLYYVNLLQWIIRSLHQLVYGTESYQSFMDLFDPLDASFESPILLEHISTFFHHINHESLSNLYKFLHSKSLYGLKGFESEARNYFAIFSYQVLVQSYKSNIKTFLHPPSEDLKSNKTSSLIAITTACKHLKSIQSLIDSLKTHFFISDTTYTPNAIFNAINSFDTLFNYDLHLDSLCGKARLRSSYLLSAPMADAPSGHSLSLTLPIDLDHRYKQLIRESGVMNSLLKAKKESIEVCFTELYKKEKILDKDFLSFSTSILPTLFDYVSTQVFVISRFYFTTTLHLSTAKQFSNRIANLALSHKLQIFQSIQAIGGMSASFVKKAQISVDVLSSIITFLKIALSEIINFPQRGQQKTLSNFIDLIRSLIRVFESYRKHIMTDNAIGPEFIMKQKKIISDHLTELERASYSMKSLNAPESFTESLMAQIANEGAAEGCSYLNLSKLFLPTYYSTNSATSCDKSNLSSPSTDIITVSARDKTLSEKINVGEMSKYFTIVSNAYTHHEQVDLEEEKTSDHFDEKIELEKNSPFDFNGLLSTHTPNNVELNTAVFLLKGDDKRVSQKNNIVSPHSFEEISQRVSEESESKSIDIEEGQSSNQQPSNDGNGDSDNITMSEANSSPFSKRDKGYRLEKMSYLPSQSIYQISDDLHSKIRRRNHPLHSENSDSLGRRPEDNPPFNKVNTPHFSEIDFTDSESEKRMKREIVSLISSEQPLQEASMNTEESMQEYKNRFKALEKSCLSENLEILHRELCLLIYDSAIRSNYILTKDEMSYNKILKEDADQSKAKGREAFALPEDSQTTRSKLRKQQKQWNDYALFDPQTF